MLQYLSPDIQGCIQCFDSFLKFSKSKKWQRFFYHEEASDVECAVNAGEKTGWKEMTNSKWNEQLHWVEGNDQCETVGHAAGIELIRVIFFCPNFIRLMQKKHTAIEENCGLFFSPLPRRLLPNRYLPDGEQPTCVLGVGF